MQIPQIESIKVGRSESGSVNVSLVFRSVEELKECVKQTYPEPFWITSEDGKQYPVSSRRLQSALEEI